MPIISCCHVGLSTYVELELVRRGVVDNKETLLMLLAEQLLQGGGVHDQYLHVQTQSMTGGMTACAGQQGLSRTMHNGFQNSGR